MFSEAPEPGLLGGVLPVAHNSLAMLTNYISPEQRFVACTNQDVVYGFGFLDNLDKEPIVFQVPDFGDRFWVFALCAHRRTVEHRQTIWHQARLLYDRRAGLEGQNSSRYPGGVALIDVGGGFVPARFHG